MERRRYRAALGDLLELVSMSEPTLARKPGLQSWMFALCFVFFEVIGQPLFFFGFGTQPGPET